MGHDVRGAELAREVLDRLRASERLRAHVAGLVRQPPAARVPRARAPAALAPHRLPLHDRLLARGGGRDAAVDSRSPRNARRPRGGGDAAICRWRRVLADALAWRSSPAPEPLIRGDDLAAELGIEPGPRLGRLLELLAEERYAGELSGREQAIARARELLRPSRLACHERPRLHLLQDRRRRDTRATIVDEDERTLAFMDIAPATRGHALVIPRAHSTDLFEHRSGGPGRRRRGRPAPGGAGDRAPRCRRREPAELMRARGLADGDPLPYPRDPPLQGRSAAPSVGPAGGRHGRDIAVRAGTGRTVEKLQPLHPASRRVGMGHMKRNI